MSISNNVYSGLNRTECHSDCNAVRDLDENGWDIGNECKAVFEKRFADKVLNKYVAHLLDSENHMHVERSNVSLARLDA